MVGYEYAGIAYEKQGEMLAARRRHYVELVLAGMGYAEAARAVGVSKRTGKVWRNGRTRSTGRNEALRDLLSQIGDPDAAHDAGVIDDDEYVERKAQKLAYTSALAAYANGEVPDLPALLEQMREQASQPTQTETNTANIDYLLMTVGGDQ